MKVFRNSNILFLWMLNFSHVKMILKSKEVIWNEISFPSFQKAILERKQRIVEFGKGFVNHFQEPGAEVMSTLWNYIKEVHDAVREILHYGREPVNYPHGMENLPAQFQVRFYDNV